MKRCKILISLLLSAIFAAMAFSVSGDTYLVSLYVGSVKYSQNGKKWAKVFPELELKEKSMVKTGIKSYCDILMPERGTFRILDNTLVQMAQLKQQMEKIKIKNGKVVFNISRKLGQGESFIVETSVANAAVRGTQFEVSATGEKTGVSVVEGSVVIQRNVDIPEEYQDDEEIQEALTVEIPANKFIELTAEENRQLEEQIRRVKSNKSEVLSALRNSREATLKKLQIMKRNIKRVLDELDKLDRSYYEENPEEPEDDTSDTIEKIRRKGK